VKRPRLSIRAAQQRSQQILNLVLVLEKFRGSPRHLQRRNPACHNIRKRAVVAWVPHDAKFNLGRTIFGRVRVTLGACSTRPFREATWWNNWRVGERNLDVCCVDTLAGDSTTAGNGADHCDRDEQRCLS
jgi:hypothetical protein